MRVLVLAQQRVRMLMQEAQHHRAVALLLLAAGDEALDFLIDSHGHQPFFFR